MATRGVCAVHGCGKLISKRRWCNAHYLRFLRHGDPLGGGRTPALPNEAMEWLLRALSVPHPGCVAWPFGRHPGGYGSVTADGAQQLVHRWVCEHAHGPPPGRDYDAAHSCGNGHLGCFNPAHLRWATRIENMADNIAMGRTTRGKQGPTRSLSAEDVTEIRRLKGTASLRALGRRFGVKNDTISAIYHGKTWSWLD